MRGVSRRQSRARNFAVRGLISILFSSLAFGVLGEQDGSNRGGADRLGDVPGSPGVYRTGTTIAVHSDLVLIPVTVTDRSGKVVSGLEKEHFTVFENSRPQEITHFAAEDAPASIGIVFDASDSMEPRLQKAREMVKVLLGQSNRDDEFFFVRFSTEARVTVPMTSRREAIQDQVERMRLGGTTALLDAVRVAIDEMQQHAKYTRKALILISDGEDNASHSKVSDLKSAVKQQDILIYAIGITDTPAYSYAATSPPTGAELLNEIASHTGGRLFEVNKLKQLPDIAAKICGWLRNQYVLGYVPNDSARDGSYRTVQLKIARPKGFPRLHAVWRKGYYAPKE